MSEQTPYEMNEDFSFEDVEFAQNPEPRCHCVLLLDCSGSMNETDSKSGMTPIEELNEGIKVFKEELSKDELSAKRVEVSVIAFNNNVDIINEHETVENFTPHELTAGGCTYMGAAIEKAVELIEERKETYKDNAISYYRPWIFLITDGYPNDDYSNAIDLVHEGEKNKHFAFFAIGVQGANMEILGEISVREPLMLKGLNFKPLFKWLSNSMSQVSNSGTSDIIKLNTPAGWAVV